MTKVTLANLLLPDIWTKSDLCVWTKLKKKSEWSQQKHASDKTLKTLSLRAAWPNSHTFYGESNFRGLSKKGKCLMTCGRVRASFFTGLQVPTPTNEIDTFLIRNFPSTSWDIAQMSAKSQPLKPKHRDIWANSDQLTKLGPIKQAWIN